MEGLTDNLRTIVKISNYSNSSISPLPVDVLRLVFHAAYGGDVADQWEENRRYTVSIKLSHVCVEWRRIAIDSALLWSEIHWAPYISLDLIQALLYRSKRASVSLNLYLKIYHNTPSLRDGIFDAVLPHISRCRVLKLDGDHASVLLFLRSISGSLITNSPNHTSSESSPFLDDQYVTAPRLTNLDISVEGVIIQDSEPLNLFGGVAPKLKDVWLMNVDAIPALRHSLGSVQILNIDRLSDDMTRCTSLVRLTYWGDRTPPSPLDLPSLRDLRWSSNDTAENAHELLTSQTWARLKFLWLDMDECHNLEVMHILSKTPDLRRASIFTQLQPIDPSPSHRAHLPHLFDLRLNFTWSTGPPHPLAILDRLIAPRLQFLTLRYGRPDSADLQEGEALWRFVRRCHPPLVRLCVIDGFEGYASDNATLLQYHRSILPIVREGLPELRLLHIHPCTTELYTELDGILTARGGSFCADAKDVEMDFEREPNDPRESWEQ